MTFSFVLPAYKGRYLRESIGSILAQDYTDLELIVVDDCSPDSIREIVESYDDKRVSYYRNEQNIGGKDLVAQWNHCLEYAKGDYVILATDDDLYAPNFLSSFVPLIEKYPDVNLFRARILQVDSRNEIKYIDSCYKEYLSPVEFRYHLMHGMKGGIPQYIFKRKALVDKGGFVYFPKAWASDDATALMMSDRGVVNSQEHLVRFRWSDINISGDRKYGMEKFMARLQFSKWLQKQEVETNDMADDWQRFYQQHVADYLPIYNKITLISTMNAMTGGDWIKGVQMLKGSDLFSFKDKCSIVLRSLKARI
jgi:glycosyltransferase involved in cell wall biosynthesis